MSAIAVSGPSSVCKASHTAESTAWSHSFVSVQSDATQMSASYRVLVDLSPKAKHPSASSGSCSKGASHACSKGVSPTGSPTGLWSYLSSPPASAPKATSLREASPLSLPTPALLKPPALSTGAAMGSVAVEGTAPSPTCDVPVMWSPRSRVLGPACPGSQKSIDSFSGIW